MSVKLWRNKPTNTWHIQIRRVFIEVLCFYARSSNNNLWLYILVIVATERSGIDLSIIDRQIRIHQSLNFKVTHFPLPHTRCQVSITSGCAVLCGEGRRAEDEEEEGGKEDAVSLNSSAQHHKDERTQAT
jgi:hypothetical protein